MTDDQAKRAEVFLRQLEIAWQNLDRRRSYEWKLSLAIWTAIAAFIAITLQAGPAKTTFEGRLPLLALLGVFIILLQGLFLLFLRLANGVDQARAHFYEDLLNETTGVCAGRFAGTPVQVAINQIAWAKGYWAIAAEVLITVCLLLTAAAVASNMRTPPTP
jgi:hypothetical protein